jgi:hypothetical protein
MKELFWHFLGIIYAKIYEGKIPLSDYISSWTHRLCQKKIVKYHKIQLIDGQLVIEEKFSANPSEIGKPFLQPNSSLTEQATMEKVNELTLQLENLNHRLREKEEELEGIEAEVIAYQQDASRLLPLRRALFGFLLCFITAFLGEFAALWYFHQAYFGNSFQLLSRVSGWAITSTILWSFIFQKNLSPKIRCALVLLFIIFIFPTLFFRVPIILTDGRFDFGVFLLLLPPTLFLPVCQGYLVSRMADVIKQADNIKEERIKTSPYPHRRKLFNEIAKLRDLMNEFEARRDELIRGEEIQQRQEQKNFEKEKLRIEAEQNEEKLYLQKVRAIIDILRIEYLREAIKKRGNSSNQKTGGMMMKKFVLAIPLFYFLGCASPINEFNVAVVLDCSSSVERKSMSSDLVKIGKWWGEKVKETNQGGEFTIFIIGNTFRECQLLFTHSRPKKWKIPVFKHKRQWEKDFEKRLVIATKDLPSNKGSNIIEAISRTCVYLDEKGGKKVLIIYSDLRHVCSKWNFEKEIPSVHTFIQWLKRKEITPNFPSGVEVKCVGFNPFSANTTTSPITQSNYNRLKNFWIEIFKKWGVPFSISEGLNL